MSTEFLVTPPQAFILLYLAALSLMLYALFIQSAYLKEFIMSESQDAVDAVVAQLAKAKGEILAEIATLQAAVDAGQPVDLTALKEAAQGLDDVVVDAPVEPSAPTE